MTQSTNERAGRLFNPAVAHESGFAIDLEIEIHPHERVSTRKPSNDSGVDYRKPNRLSTNCWFNISTILL